MYLVSLHGHGTSAWPGSSGAPKECIAGTNGRSVPSASRTLLPMRAITRMETTTYSESVISTPRNGSSASIGPMQNGMTYMVRPRMHPRYSSVIVAFISAGSIQLLVGPASASSTEQMNVLSSTRATSSGSGAAYNGLGFFSSFSFTKVPGSPSLLVIRSHSASDPSHHTTLSGVVSSAISRTQDSRRAFRVGASSIPGTVIAVIFFLAPHRSPGSGNGSAHPGRSAGCASGKVWSEGSRGTVFALPLRLSGGSQDRSCNRFRGGVSASLWRTARPPDLACGHRHCHRVTAVLRPRSGRRRRPGEHHRRRGCEALRSSHRFE